MSAIGTSSANSVNARESLTRFSSSTARIPKIFAFSCLAQNHRFPGEIRDFKEGRKEGPFFVVFRPAIATLNRLPDL